MTAKPDAPEIRLPVPPRVYAKLKEIAGYRSVEDWARSALVDAAEEASPSLRDSRMWSGTPACGTRSSTPAMRTDP